MIPNLLDAIGIRWQHHKSALWWLGLLYRRPAQFKDAFLKISLRNKLGVGLFLWFHAFPYIASLCLLGRFVVFGLVDFQIDLSLGVGNAFVSHAISMARGIVEGVIVAIVVGSAFGVVFGVARGIVLAIAFGATLAITLSINSEATFVLALGVAFGIVFGIAFGVSFWITRGIAHGIIFGFAVGFGLGIALKIDFSTASRIVIGIALGMTLVIAFSIARAIRRSDFRGILLGIPLGVLGEIFLGNSEGIIFGITFLFIALRLYYYPFHLLYFWPEVRGDWYYFHPVVWDDICFIPFPKLDRLLIAYAQQAPEASAKEIERLIINYPSQRSSALRAKEALIAREAGGVKNLAFLNSIVARLPEGESGFLSEARDIRKMIQEISSLQLQLNNTIDRPVLSELRARLIYSEIENFQQKIGGFHEPLRTEFRKAASRWLQIAQQQLKDTKAVLAKEPNPQVFRAGDPVKPEIEAFVSRDNVLGELEKQIMRSSGSPGLGLYGRRRTGKSTILRNLPRFLPNTVMPMVISMQDPNAFTSIKDFSCYIVKNIKDVLPEARKFDDNPTDLLSLFRFLSNCNNLLEKNNRHLLLGLDEYENIDIKIGKKIFPQDLLATIRESIQSHRYITWAFAGSHEITELKHASWTSYLISVHTIEVPMFTLAETRLLLTEPLKYSTLWPKDSTGRPRFQSDFWGNGGIERIYVEAAGWPYLVQLIAETVVDLINEEDTRQVDTDLLERALEIAIVRGHNFLYYVMHQESTLPGEWEYLAAFRKRETQPPPDDKAIYTSLRRRLLVEKENGEWRLRVPLMARWLRERG